MLRKVLFIFLYVYAVTSFASEKNALANGYWLQKDPSTKSNTSEIHAYSNKVDNLNA